MKRKNISKFALLVSLLTINTTANSFYQCVPKKDYIQNKEWVKGIIKEEEDKKWKLIKEIKLKDRGSISDLAVIDEEVLDVEDLDIENATKYKLVYPITSRFGKKATATFKFKGSERLFSLFLLKSGDMCLLSIINPGRPGTILTKFKSRSNTVKLYKYDE